MAQPAASGPAGSRAAPDGYTPGIGYWGTHVANGALYALTYDVVSDFEPISLLAESPLLIVANKATPANDLEELVGWLKQNPTAILPGSARVTDLAAHPAVLRAASRNAQFGNSGDKIGQAGSLITRHL
jgi:tripartite-type tricarboxylate transporter receptor subunit TctC